MFFIILCFTVVYGIDSLFGSSSLKFKPNGEVNINFSQSIVTLYVKDAKIYLKKYLPLSKIENFRNINNGESISYRYLLRDSSKKQALIILESWGLNNDVLERMEQIRPIVLLNNSGYSVNLDSSLFYGGTSLIIMVGVAIDTIQQINSYLLNRHYDGLMKAGNSNRKSNT